MSDMGLKSKEEEIIQHVNDINQILKKDIIRRLLSHLGHKNELDIEFTTYEKWNWDGSEEPGPNGYFDKEGSAWSDVLVGQRLNFFNYRDILYIGYFFKRSIKAYVNFFDRYWLIPTPMSVLLAIKSTILLIIRRECWKTFCLASLAVAEDDMPDEKKDEITEDKDRLDQVIDILKKEGYVSILHGDEIFVNSENPQFIYIDERKYPFDLRDGWSDKKIKKIIIEMALTLLFANYSKEYSKEKRK